VFRTLSETLTGDADDLSTDTYKVSPPAERARSDFSTRIALFPRFTSEMKEAFSERLNVEPFATNSTVWVAPRRTILEADTWAIWLTLCAEKTASELGVRVQGNELERRTTVVTLTI